MSERNALQAFEDEIKAVLNAQMGIAPEDCRHREYGMSGGGGFVIDHGTEAKIIAIGLGVDHLKVKYACGVDYHIMEIYTDDTKKADAVLRAKLPCSAGKTQNPYSFKNRVMRPLRRHASLIFMILLFLASMLLQPALGVIAMIVGGLIAWLSSPIAGAVIAALGVVQFLVTKFAFDS